VTNWEKGLDSSWLPREMYWRNPDGLSRQADCFFKGVKRSVAERTDLLMI